MSKQLQKILQQSSFQIDKKNYSAYISVTEISFQCFKLGYYINSANM